MEGVRTRLLILVVCLALAGCGSDQQAATNGADIVPASAAAFISIDTDADGSQWERAEGLIGKFPDGEAAIRELRGSFEEDTKLDWEDDVKPALGETFAVVWLDAEEQGQNLVGLTQPRDEDKLRDLIAKANATDEEEDVVVGEHAGWSVLATSQARIDRFKREAARGDKLAEDTAFEDALAELPDDALVTAFARGQSLVDLAGSFFLTGAFGFTQPTSGDRPESVATALVAEGGGFRVTSVTRTEVAPSVAPEVYESRLLAEVPADSLAFLSARGGAQVDRQLDQLPADALRELERELGLEIQAITALFENEFALYVRTAIPIPEVTLLLAADDEQAALRTIGGLIEQVTRREPAQPCHEPEMQAGVEVRCVEFDDFALRYAAFDGKVVITTGRQSIEEIRSGGPRLADDEGFKKAREASGLPDRTAGFLWLDVEDGLPLLLGLAEARNEDVPDELRRNFEPVTSVVGWADQDGRTSGAELFVAID